MSLGLSNVYNFHLEINKVLEQVQPNVKINDDALFAINAILHHHIERIVYPCIYLVGYARQQTCNSRTIQTAIRLIMPNNLAKHCVSEGTKSLTKFYAYEENKKEKLSMSFKAGLHFSVACIRNILHDQIREINEKLGENITRVSLGAPIYLAAAIEYLCAEIIDFAGKMCINTDEKTITAKHVFSVIRSNDELNQLTKEFPLSDKSSVEPSV